MKKTLLKTLIGTLILGSCYSPCFADSLWNDTSVANWYIDRRPTFVIGGLISVNVLETLKTNTNATFQGNKILQNVHKWEIPQYRTNQNTTNGATNDGDAMFNNQLKTDSQVIQNSLGATTRNGALTFNISSHIEDILPNGNLVIRGRKQIRVNDEISIIAISGVIRRDDVNSSNIVMSAKIANMQIDVKGSGPVSAKTTGGFISRLFNFLI